MGISSETSFVYILFLELYDFHQSLNMRGHELRKRAAPVNREEMDTALWSSSWQQEKGAVWGPGNGQDREDRDTSTGLQRPACPTCLTWHSKSTIKLKNNVNRFSNWGFPGDSVLQNLPASAGRHGLDPWSRKIPHASKQLSSCATTTQPVL